jgi:pimeloyl-ACP methyl ester carboxylesterase
VPVENVRALHQAIPGSRYAELESGHVVFAEKPDELATLIRAFLLDEPGPDGDRTGGVVHAPADR